MASLRRNRRKLCTERIARKRSNLLRSRVSTLHYSAQQFHCDEKKLLGIADKCWLNQRGMELRVRRAATESVNTQCASAQFSRRVLAVSNSALQYTWHFFDFVHLVATFDSSVDRLLLRTLLDPRQKHLVASSCLHHRHVWKSPLGPQNHQP